MPRFPVCITRIAAQPLLQFDEHITRLNLHRKALRATNVRRNRLTALEFNRLIVQRACDTFAKHNALRQRTALVRTFVEQREHNVFVIAKHGDVAALVFATFDHARAEHGKFIEFADIAPIHMGFNLHSFILRLKSRVDYSAGTASAIGATGFIGTN